MLFNLDLANNTILSCLFLFFLIIELHVLVPAAVAQSFNGITEFVIPIGIPSKEAKVETEIHPVITEGKMRKCSR